jgi:hypothetical protein
MTPATPAVAAHPDRFDVAQANALLREAWRAFACPLTIRTFKSSRRRPASYAATLHPAECVAQRSRRPGIVTAHLISEPGRCPRQAHGEVTSVRCRGRAAGTQKHDESAGTRSTSDRRSDLGGAGARCRQRRGWPLAALGSAQLRGGLRSEGGQMARLHRGRNVDHDRCEPGLGVTARGRGDRPRPRRRDSRDPGQHRPRLRPAGQDPLDLPARCRCRGDLDPALAPCRDLTTSDPSPGRGPTAISSQLIAGLSCGDVLQAELVSGIAVGASRG